MTDTALAARPPLALRIGLPVSLLAFALAALLAVPPIAQDPAYHAFADTRGWLGIANFGDVASNLGYLAAGLAGLAFLASRDGRRRFVSPDERLPWIAFFAGACLVAAGSGWYHLAPANETLVWDRLAMSVTFMALFAGFAGDRLAPRFGARMVLPVMTVLGVASVLWWHASETAGAGDLRFYFLLNPLWPAATLLLLCAIRPGRLTRGPWVLLIGACYALAILCEQRDEAIFMLTDGLVSGHTLKHLMSSGAVFAVVWMLWRAPPVSR